MNAEDQSSPAGVYCFQVHASDNVATALSDLSPGPVSLIGVSQGSSLTATEQIALGHKIALRDLVADEKIVKYGVTIGLASTAISAGSWVHLHNCRSQVDERSAHLDVKTGAALDTVYA